MYYIESFEIFLDNLIHILINNGLNMVEFFWTFPINFSRRSTPPSSL